MRGQIFGKESMKERGRVGRKRRGEEEEGEKGRRRKGREEEEVRKRRV